MLRNHHSELAILSRSYASLDDLLKVERWEPAKKIENWQDRKLANLEISMGKILEGCYFLWKK